MSNVAERTRRPELVARGLILVGLLLDLFVLRSVLLGREGFLVRFSRWTTPIAVLEALAALAVFVHLVAVLREPREGKGAPSSDDRLLLVGSGFLAAVYLAAHFAFGPLGTLARCGDAFTLYASLRDRFPTYAVATTNAVGLVAVGLHAFELSARSGPAGRRRARGAIAVALAIVYGALALDPIVLLTTGRPLFSRVGDGPRVMAPDNSARVPAR